ncbi:YxiJ family protein [Paenibacillus thiaminolyticus]|uniref:YxiJ family protein n=1 Tax=Paenibacillus thiaminolyticus TaxID=49283 RepID=UPI0035A60382
MNKVEILEKISYLNNFQLVNPYPYEDTKKIKSDFEMDFISLEDESFNADFNEYCTVIVGTTSYILKGKATNIPKKQVELLNEDFFQRFPKYRFIETSLKNYPDFQAEYNNHEQLRKLILDYLHSN